MLEWRANRARTAKREFAAQAILSASQAEPSLDKPKATPEGRVVADKESWNCTHRKHRFAFECQEIKTRLGIYRRCQMSRRDR
jgi:hypothetical protein